MKLARHQAVLAVVVLLLIGVNVWHWWPRSTATHRMGIVPVVASAGRLEPQDFELKIADVPPQRPPPGRDLFWPAPAVVKTAKQPALPPAPPPKTPEELAAEAARAELARIKVVGVAFRGDKGQAYIVLDDQTYLAGVGDKVGNRFLVETITTDSATLRDPNTGVNSTIPVSGN